MNLQFIKENIINNAELYAVSSSVIILYYDPYLFLCISSVFLVYNIYISDFQYDIRVSNIKKNRKFNLTQLLNMDKPLSDNDLNQYMEQESKTKLE